MVSCTKPKEEILLEYVWDGIEMPLYPIVTTPDSTFIVREDTIRYYSNLQNYCMIFNEDYTVKLYQVVWHRTPKYYEDSDSIITYDNQMAAIYSFEYKWDYDKR